ncbi:MAG: hypothetical protein VX792_07475 [Candidatus Latescibacterota bacterium]|nr:hypothetical protein [Candidatus Latescibacterota bacterium]
MHKKRPARLSLLRPVEIEDDVWAALNAAKPARCGAQALTFATQAGEGVGASVAERRCAAHPTCARRSAWRGAFVRPVHTSPFLSHPVFLFKTE